MRKQGLAASIVVALAAWSVDAQTPPASGDVRYPIDTSGLCIYPRDFSHISIDYRARVRSFWDSTVYAHRLAQQRIRDDTLAELRRNYVDRRVDLTDEQKQLRERIAADGWAKQRHDQTEYKQEYDDLLVSLPAADRQPAARALAGLVMPVDPNCPKGFEIDPQK